MHKGRLEAFSDGVFAIIITIMVLDFKVPESSSLNGLRSTLPVFLSYILGFIYVALYWNNHHHLLQASEHVSGAIRWGQYALAVLAFSCAVRDEVARGELRRALANRALWRHSAVRRCGVLHPHESARRASRRVLSLGDLYWARLERARQRNDISFRNPSSLQMAARIVYMLRACRRDVAVARQTHREKRAVKDSPELARFLFLALISELSCLLGLMWRVRSWTKPNRA